MLIASYVWLMRSVLGMDQARQIFQGLPALATLIAAGFLRLSTVWRDLIAALFAVGLGLIGATSLGLVPIAFAPPAVAATTSQLPVPLDFGNTIRVSDYQIDQPQVVPGDTVAVDIRWQALRNPSENYWLLLQLAGEAGEIAKKDGVPSAGRLTTDWWQTGQTSVSRHELTVPSDLPPGIYALRLGLHPFGLWEWLPVAGQEMVELGKVTVVTGMP